LLFWSAKSLIFNEFVLKPMKTIILLASFIVFLVLFSGCIGTTPQPKCFVTLENQLEGLKTQLETGINQNVAQTIDFSGTECNDSDNEQIKISLYNQPKICGDFCATGQSICTLLEYSNSKTGVYFKKCLDIPLDTIFSTQEYEAQSSTKHCENRQAKGKTLTDLKENIPHGTYEIINKTTPQDNFPVICAYKKNE